MKELILAITAAFRELVTGLTKYPLAAVVALSTIANVLLFRLLMQQIEKAETKDEKRVARIEVVTNQKDSLANIAFRALSNQVILLDTVVQMKSREVQAANNK